MFAQCVNEFFDVIDNQRYILVKRKGKKEKGGGKRGKGGKKERGKGGRRRKKGRKRKKGGRRKKGRGTGAKADSRLLT